MHAINAVRKRSVIHWRRFFGGIRDINSDPTINIYTYIHEKFFVLSSSHIDIAVVTFDLFSIYEILNFLRRFCTAVHFHYSLHFFCASSFFAVLLFVILLLRHFPFSLFRSTVCSVGDMRARQELRTHISLCVYNVYTRIFYVNYIIYIKSIDLKSKRAAIAKLRNPKDVES